MKILITGVAGMIGSNLAHWILENTGDTILGIDNLSGGFIENMPILSDRFLFLGEDVCNNKSINEIFKVTKPDVCFHFAAYAAENLSPFIRCFNYTNNLVGTASIVNACINNSVGRLVFASSIAVYGHGKPPFKETDITTPNDPYGNAKLSCEVDIKIAGEQHGLDWCIVRPYNVYGRRQNIKDKYRNVLGIFINQGMSGKPLTIFGDGTQQRSFTNISDIMRPLYLAGTSIKSVNKIINLGSEKQYRVIDAAYAVEELLPCNGIEYLESRHEVHTAYADNTLAKEILEFKDTVTLHTGIMDMIKWVKTNPTIKETISPEYEVSKGMYRAWQK